MYSMNSGYSGYSKSKNAEWAEEENRYPLTRALPIFKNKVKIELKLKLNSEKCKVILEKYWSGEWHHSSKYCNKINYYDIDEIFDSFKENLKEDLKELEKMKKEDKKIEKDIFLYIKYREYKGSRRNGRYIYNSSFFKKLNENWGSTGSYKKNLKGNNILKITEINNFKDLKEIYLEEFKKDVVVTNISAIKRHLCYATKKERKRLEKIVKDNEKEKLKKAQELMKIKFPYKNFKQFIKRINSRFINKIKEKNV